jgi:hypothetical protein
MSAYNWIEIVEKCPTCGKISKIKLQTHIASSYDGTDNIRFHDNNYKVGNKMNWFDKNDERYSLWKNGNSKNITERNIDLECCYGICELCNTESYAIIVFEKCVISSVKSVGTLEEWPEEFYK